MSWRTRQAEEQDLGISTVGGGRFLNGKLSGSNKAGGVSEAELDSQCELPGPQALESRTPQMLQFL